jgi:hypothetical protein
MPEELTVTSLKDILRFPFQEPNWQSRFIIGVGLIFASLFIPIPLVRWIPLILVSGYALKVMRQAVKGEGLFLPAWEDWGELGMDGLRGLLINLVYLLPGILVFYGGMGLYFVLSMAFPLLMAFTEESRGMLALFPLLVFGSLAIMLLSMFVGSLLFLLGVIPLPMARAHFVAKGEVAAAFRVREWWPLLRINKLGYFIAWVVVYGLTAILSLVLVLAYYSVILCCFVPFLVAPIGFYLSLVSAALFGQTYRESVAMLSASESASD